MEEVLRSQDYLDYLQREDAQNVLTNNSKVDRQSLKEDSFIHEVFEPVIKPFFHDTNFKCEWSTDVLEASVHRKHKFDPSLQRRQADFSIYVPIKDKRIYLLTSEIKSADYM
nr:9874_t:CDS:2 [Entrophospora candida]